MDDQKWFAEVARLMGDTEPILMGITIRDLWMIDSALSLSYRHPGITDVTKAWFLNVSVQIRAAIAAKYPDAGKLLDMGWHEEYDQPIDYDKNERLNRMMEEKLERWQKKQRQDGGQSQDTTHEKPTE